MIVLQRNGLVVGAYETLPDAFENVQDGDHLLVQPGIYHGAATLETVGGVTIEGLQRPTILGGTTLDWEPCDNYYCSNCGCWCSCRPEYYQRFNYML